MSLENNCHCIQELECVILKSDNLLKLVELRKNKPFYLGKRNINLSSVIGQPYGSYFELASNGTLKIVASNEAVEKMCVKVEEEESVKDNRSLTDTGESQKLTTRDIESYKKQGVSGNDMVKIIVENSSSFNIKTAFSKEKYLRKKQMKYLNIIQILKPNIRLLADMYYSQGPMKICNLRIDSLSQMLSFCNVMSGGKYIIIETVMGLLAASVLDRLGMSGCIVQLHLGPFSIFPSQQALKALNLDNEQTETEFYNIDFKTAVTLIHPSKDVEMIIDTNDGDNDKDSVAELPKKRQKIEKEDHIQKAKEILSQKNMDSLIVAVKNHPANVIPLLNFLAISRPFAIFSMYREPLVDCYVILKARGDIISLNITETWFRKYQVLPERTHPFYNMSGNGGFLLTGIKVAPKPQV